MTAIHRHFRALATRSRALAHEQGQTLVEYGLLVSVLVVLALASLSALGGGLSTMLGRVTGGLSGATTTTATTTTVPDFMSSTTTTTATKTKAAKTKTKKKKKG